MKMLKKVFVFLLILSPLLAVPKQSKAGLIGDLISDIFGGGKDKEKDKDKKPKSSDGNSVPVNGGLVFLVIAGAGLGAKMIYDRKKGVAV
jgi:hypothetical protein